MNIIVIGAGVVGASLAEQLSQEGHRVSIVDKSRKPIHTIGEKLDALCVHGNAAQPSILRHAGIEDAQMVIAVTNVDETNLVVGMLAAEFGVKHRIVRIRNQEYVHGGVLSLQKLGIGHVINPEPTIVKALAGMLEFPGTTDYATLANGEVLMLGFDISDDSPVAGKQLSELDDLGELEGFLFLYITRGDEVIVPRGHHRIEPGDNVHLLVARDMARFLVPIIHRRPWQVNLAIVIGASRVGVELAKKLEEQVDQVFLIETDTESAEEAAVCLDKTTVLNGEPTDLDVLDEAGIHRCDLFYAVSGDDELNMLSALLAKKHSQTVAAAVIHKPSYVPVLGSLGVETVINPRLVTVGEILTYVRGGHVHSVTRVAESRAEILEVVVPDGSPVLQKSLRELSFPEHALVGAYLREGEMHIPNGDTRFEKGDRVLVFTLPDATAQVERLFAKQAWFTR